MGAAYRPAENIERHPSNAESIERISFHDSQERIRPPIQLQRRINAEISELEESPDEYIAELGNEEDL